jgi:hypothetical protein
LFRDRILSLGLRSPLTVEISPELASSDGYVLTGNDFAAELGKSPVHDRAVQLRLYDMISSTCRLTQYLSGPLSILYKHELLLYRVTVLSRSGATVLSKITKDLEDLANWHSQATRLFPPLITIDGDDVHKSISIFANVLSAIPPQQCSR